MEKILSSLLYRSNITNVDTQDLHLQLLSHNEYPSIKAVTDTLDYFGIENVAANVPVDALAQMPEHFLALINENEQTELVLVKKQPNKIQYTNQNNKKHKMSYGDFSAIWSGTIVAIEKEEKKPVSRLLSISATSVFLALAAALAIGMVALSGSIVSAGYLSLAVIGLIISYLTTKEELGIKDKVATKVCGAISGDALGCSNVINSREGKIFGVLSLADASLLFFVTTFLFGLFYGTENAVLYGLAVLSIPVVLLSIYLQTFKLKQFCLLCLLTSAVVLSQFVLLQATFTGWDFSWNIFLGYLFIASGSTSVWLVIKKFWKDSNNLTQTLKEYYTFKRNSVFFMSALQQKEPYEMESLSSQYQISFGRSNAPVKIHAVTNPLCGFCKTPFDTYVKLLDTYPNEVEVNLVFNVSSDPDNKSNQITSRFLEFYQQDQAKAFKALQDWFGERDVEKWQAKYGLPNSMLLRSEKILEVHHNWCNDNEIFHTPESIVNGYPFPKNEYKIEDLQFFIDPLKEAFRKSEQTIAI